MSKKEKVLKVLIENPDVDSLSEARKLLRQEQILEVPTKRSRDLGIFE